MAQDLTTYSGLKAAIGDWLVRDDLTAMAAGFISLVEFEFNRVIRHRFMEVRGPLAITSSLTALPSDCLELKSVAYTGDPGSGLDFIPPEDVANFTATHSTAGRPGWYSLEANNIRTLPTPDTTYSYDLLYYGRITPLSDSAPSNWLLVEAGDLYLWGALLQASPYIKDDPRITVWQDKYDAAMSSLNSSNEHARYGGGSLVTRSKTVF